MEIKKYSIKLIFSILLIWLIQNDVIKDQELELFLGIKNSLLN